MAKSTYGMGTLFKRGRIWYVSYWIDGRQIQRSSKSSNIQDAKRVRDQILGIKASTTRIWELVIEANIRPIRLSVIEKVIQEVAAGDMIRRDDSDFASEDSGCDLAL